MLDTSLPSNAHTYLTVGQVAAKFSVSTDTIWRWKRNGDFPKPVRVGPNCTRWRLSDIEAHESTFQACFAMHFDCFAA